jgi:hypothetical protein
LLVIQIQKQPRKLEGERRAWDPAPPKVAKPVYYKNGLIPMDLNSLIISAIDL